MRRVFEDIASLCITLTAIFLGGFAFTIVSGAFVFRGSEKLLDWHIGRIFWWNVVLWSFLGLSIFSVIVHCFFHALSREKK